MRRTALIAAVPASAVLVAIVAASAPAAPAQTPDQRLAAAFQSSDAAGRAALRRLARPTRSSITAARANLEQAAVAIGTASDAATRAVGALETAAVQEALARVTPLLQQARGNLTAGRYSRARAKVRATLPLLGAALRDFGIPLARDFASFAVDRDFRNVRGFANYSGLTATAAEEVTEVVIGPADRATANVGETAEGAIEPGGGLPISQISVYVIRDPIGRFTSNWCTLDQGLITCRLRPTLRPEYSYTIAFAPKLDRGTKVLVKFRTADGKRSYAVLTTR